MAVSSGCSLWSRTGERGNGMASLGGTVRGERRARGLWRMGEGSGWYGEQGVEGSDWTEDGGGPVCGRGLERVVCRGLWGERGLAGSVCVLGSTWGARVRGDRGAMPLNRGPPRGECVGLQLGDWQKSGDWGGTKNRRTGYQWGAHAPSHTHTHII